MQKYQSRLQPVQGTFRGTALQEFDGHGGASCQGAEHGPRVSALILQRKAICSAYLKE